MPDFETTLDRFFHIASDICDEILAFQPDVVIGLMHSGWLPLYAGMKLWKGTQHTLFPPIARVNLGREKFKRFDDLDGRPGVTDHFIGEYEMDEGIAYFLAWLYDQTYWQNQLRSHVEKALNGVPPRRILIVDEFIHEGTTWMLALGLLNVIYPDAEVRFYNANLEYKDSFLLEWAKTQHPELLATDLFPSGDLKIPGPAHQAAVRMVVGTEDVDPDSLDWKPMLSTDTNLELLSGYLPASIWLELPQFAEKIISDEIFARADQYVPNPNMDGKRLPQLAPGILILREIYRHGPLTIQEVGRNLGWPVARARYQMEKQIGRGYLVAKCDTNVNRYVLSPRTKPEYWKGSSELETYWALPGRILAGDMPGYGFVASDKERLLARLKSLLDQGANFFLDLSHRYSNESETYGSVLMSLASEYGKDIKYFAVQIPARRLPKKKTIQSILDLADQALEEGKVLYVHDSDGLVTEAVLGCYFVRHGMKGSDALRELEWVRQGMRDGWRRAPAQERARRLVREWRE